MEDQSTSEIKITEQTPICTFCYKWCPRMLMLLGFVSSVGTVCYEWLPSKPTMFNQVGLILFLITAPLALFTLVLKILRAHI